MTLHSKSDYAALVARQGRARVQPVKAEGELLAVFVEGLLANPMNATWGHWKRRRWAERWKERVAMALLEAPRPDVARAQFMRSAEKHVTFTANVFNRLDGDGLQASLKPVRDALVACGVISGDADRDGHVFTYDQRIDRKNRGVEIRVSLLQPTPPAGGGRGR